MLKKLLYLCAVVHLLALPAFATAPELCGDGIDNDSSGGDLACPGDDSDNDGYRDKAIGGSDCDDTDPFIYPGVYVGGTDPFDYKQCDPLPADGGGGTGEYVGAVEDATSSSNFFTCDGAGDTIFIDCSGNGDNADDGLSPANAYADFTNLHRTTGSNPYTAGDCIVPVCTSGTSCSCTFSAMTDDATAQFPFRVTDGTADNPIILRGYPGHTVTLNPGCNSGTPCSVVSSFYSDYVKVSDLTITGGYGRGIWNTGASNNTYERLIIHGIRGTDSTSVDGNGIYLLNVVAGTDLNHIIAYDNHKATSNATNIQNSGNIIIVDSEATVAYAWLWFNTNTLAITSGGRNLFIKKNDASSSGTTSVSHVLAGNGYNADFWFSGPVTATNLLSVTPGDSGIRFEDGGDPASEIGGSITYSTMTGAATPFFVKTDDADSLYGTNVFKNNVLVQGSSSDSIVRMSRYAATNLDAFLADYVDGATNNFDENCYYDAATISWNLAASDGGATYSTFANWQAATYVAGGDWLPDPNSFEENPSLSTAYVAESTNCTGKGFLGSVTYLDTLRASESSGLNLLMLKKRRLK